MLPISQFEITDKKIEFKDFNVATDSEARNEMMTKSGQMGVPVVDIDGQIIIGFDKDKITAALKL